jgi:hypothetical protein
MRMSTEQFKKLCEPQLELFSCGKIDETEFWR